MKIYEAIIEVMRIKGKPLSAKEAYKEIIKHGLYEFGAANPANVVNTLIKRHCKGIPQKKGYSKTKYFEAKDGNKYYFLDSPEVIQRSREREYWLPKINPSRSITLQEVALSSNSQKKAILKEWFLSGYKSFPRTTKKQDINVDDIYNVMDVMSDEFSEILESDFLVEVADEIENEFRSKQWLKRPNDEDIDDYYLDTDYYGNFKASVENIKLLNAQSNIRNWSPQQNCLIANGAKVCSIRVMKPPRPEPTLPEIDPEEQGARYWYERYCEQLAETEQLKRRVKELEKQFESLNEKLRKLSERTSETSSQPPSSDGPKKPNRDQQKPQRKRGPKYNHSGTTRNGFGWINHAELLDVQNCPICGGAVERQPQGTQRQQVAELVPELVEVWEYERPLYRCPACGWQGYQDLPLGCREGFSYGGRLSSVVGWLGYGGNLSWSKQRYVVESIFGIPMSQGSLAKLHQWFCEALQPAYEQWWTWIQQPGVRCVDETSYRLNGVNHWIWIATAPECCVLFFAPSRSSAEVKTLLGEDFAGILSSDCWSAYGPQSAVAKQKCWAHLQRELKALTTSRFPENREFAHRVFPIIHTARQAHRDYHQGQLSLAELQALRPIVEAELADVLEHPHQGRWAADSQALSNRFRRHWSDWFTFLTSPAVSPDNNEAERGLRPVVIHRKVTGGARSDWGAQLVAMMFSCLESMRRQGKNAVDHLFELIASSGCSPPALLPG
jgi:transposase